MVLGDEADRYVRRLHDQTREQDGVVGAEKKVDGTVGAIT